MRTGGATKHFLFAAMHIASMVEIIHFSDGSSDPVFRYYRALEMVCHVVSLQTIATHYILRHIAPPQHQQLPRDIVPTIKIFLKT